MPDTPKNFKDFPKSLAEIKADKEGRGDLWTPREALISLLREIDNGEKNPTDLVITYQQASSEQEDAISCHFVASCRNITTALGLLSRAAHYINT